MVTDPIADMLVQIKNAALAGRKVVELPHSKVKEEVGKVLKKEGYLSAVEKTGKTPKLLLLLTISYRDDTPVLTDLKRISKPGLRVYVDRHSIPQVVGGMGISVLSTPEGIMTGKDAKKKGIGGEVLCKVW